MRSGQARQWAEKIEALQGEREILLKPKDSLSLGALFCCDFGAGPEWFFFAAVAGGQAIEAAFGKVTVITAQSPLVARLKNLKAGDTFHLPDGNAGVVLSVE